VSKIQNPVECLDCKLVRANPKDSLCRACRMRRTPKKYPFTAEMDDYIRKIYADNSVNKKDLSAAITAFADRHKMPRHQVTLRASRLGLAFNKNRRRWTAEEIDTLHTLAGTKGVNEIARRLHRAYTSVSAMMDSLRISRKVMEGYTCRDVSMVLGVSPRTVDKWILDGRLKVDGETGRVTEMSLSRFIRNHPDKYSLKRVDETWFKGMIFPSFGVNFVSRNGVEGRANGIACSR
jgi:hypothetical protein